jgi:hypothetical protein
MAVTVSTPTRHTATSWRITFSSDETSPVFRVWYQGRLIAITTDTEIIIESTAEPAVEVADSPDTLTSQQAYPGRSNLQFFGVASAATYRIYEYVSGNWVLVDEQDEDGLGYYTSESRWLEDGQTHQFKIVSTNSEGIEGSSVSYYVKIARKPDPRAWTMTWDADQEELVVS